MAAFRYHKNVHSRQYVNDVFMVITDSQNLEPTKPLVVKAKTPAVINKRSRISRSKQGQIIWSASYGFRIKTLHNK